jgi:uncharacterized membrane protein
VLAIAITLLVLDLHVPLPSEIHGNLGSSLAHEWPAYAAYITSFLVIGIIWVNHHAVFELIERVDRVALFLNLLLLMTVVAIPFTTAQLSEYLLAGGTNARTSALVYSGVMLAMSCGFAALYSYIARHRCCSLTASTRARSRVHRRFSAVGSCCTWRRWWWRCSAHRCVFWPISCCVVLLLPADPPGASRVPA